MTINELNTSKWQEFAFDLVDAKKRQILEKPYQERIEAAFRALGWSKAKGEICPKERINVGADNQLEPDITFKISGKSVFVVEVKQPTNKLTTRQEEQLLSYMRMRQVVFGLYIGDEIRLFYDNGDALPTSVMQIDIDTEASIEPHVSVNHSGTFVTRSKIPFGESANGYSFEVHYGYYY